MNILRLIFRLLNKFFMIPVFKLGLGPFMGNPISGYIMVLKTIGHKSGLTRYAPVNYAILDGNIYCLSGFGKLVEENWMGDGSWSGTIEIPAGLSSDLIDQLNNVTHGEVETEIVKANKE